MNARAEAVDKAGILIEALPYMRSYRGLTVVVKIGGAALADPQHASFVAEDLALMSLVGIRLVVVHGGGPQVSAAMAAAGLDARFVGGLRVTSPEALAIARRELIGGVNADIVERLGKAGLRAVGLSGIDGTCLQAVPITGPEGEDLGRVGAIDKVDTAILQSLLDAGATPVLASIATGNDGVLNVNADSAAGAVAAAMGAAKLVYLTNVEGLYTDLGDSGSLVSELKVGELEGLLASLSSGMRPKATSAVEAIKGGVGKAHILDGRVHHALLLEVFTDEGIGTQVLP